MQNVPHGFYIPKKLWQFLLFLYFFTYFFPSTMVFAVDDAFFDEAVYTQLWRGYVRPDGKREFTVDGSLIDEKKYKEVRLTRQEVKAIAKERLISEAADLGIDKKDISKAIIEGSFTPSLRDFKLAYEGIGEPSEDYLREYGAHIVEYFTGNKKLNSDGTVPFDNFLFNNVKAGWKNPRWNEEFGSMADMGQITTIIDGKKVVDITGEDLVLNKVCDRSRDRCANDYGVDPNKHLSFTEIIKQFEDAEEFDKANTLKSEINALTKNNSIYSYFYFSPNEKDYELIRKKLYLPRLEKLSTPRIN